MSDNSRVNQHAENVWSYHHNWVRVEPAIGMILTDDGWVVVDGGSCPPHGREVFDAMREIADKPVVKLIATHRHFDHTFGNQVFDGPVLSGRRCKERYDTNLTDDWGPELVQKWLKNEMLPHIPGLSEGDFVDLELPPIDETFDDELELEIGGVTMELFHLPGVHTDDSIAVYLPDAKVIFLSDAFYLLEGPEGKFTNLPGLLEQVSQLDIKHYVPGHERPHNHEIYQLLVEYTNELLNEIKVRIAEGASKEEIRAIPINKKYLEQKTSFIGERMHKRHIRDAYRELTSEG